MAVYLRVKNFARFVEVPEILKGDFLYGPALDLSLDLQIGSEVGFDEVVQELEIRDASGQVFGPLQPALGLVLGRARIGPRLFVSLLCTRALLMGVGATVLRLPFRDAIRQDYGPLGLRILATAFAFTVSLVTHARGSQAQYGRGTTSSSHLVCPDPVRCVLGAVGLVLGDLFANLIKIALQLGQPVRNLRVITDEKLQQKS